MSNATAPRGTHQLLPSVSMPCPKCGNWTNVIHSVSETSEGSTRLQQSCPSCCPVCVQKPPLEENEIKPVTGEQGGLWDE